MASTCNFGTFLARALRDQFVSGVLNKDKQRKLLEEDREFAACLAVATADEAAARESLHFTQQNASVQQVNFVKGKKPATGQSTMSSTYNTTKKGSSYVCYSCGKSDHR